MFHSKIKLFLLLFSFIFLTAFFPASESHAFLKSKPSDEADFNDTLKNVILIDNGLEFKAATRKNTVREMLEENKINVAQGDLIVPSMDHSLRPGDRIEIFRAIPIRIDVDGQKLEKMTFQKSVRDAIIENGIALSHLDEISPPGKTMPVDGMKIAITRINQEEKIVNETVDFKTVEKKDSELGWREKKVQQPGEKGTDEIKYQINYRNGKEVSRKVLEKKRIKEPIEELVIQGTYVKTGKSHKGLGTWYSFKGGMFAASPWLPMGSYARVTNTENGKSVMVQINDRGPFGPNRIIDLDKVAFAKIAGVGEGVINVKVEEVLN
jgi:uncharacterized protein YabE (DUF348 family)